MTEHKKSQLSVILGFSLFIIIGFVGMFKMKFFIANFGSEYNGGYQTFAQILIYLSLFEAGLSAVVLSKMYEPMHNDDTNYVAQLIRGARIYWYRIGYITIAAGLLALPLFSLLVRGLPIELFITLAVTSIVRLVVPYFFYDSIILVIADNKVYFSTLMTNIFLLLSAICAIISIFIFQNFVITIAIETLIIAFGNIVNYYIFRHKYKKYYQDVEPRFDFKDEIKGTSTLRITEAITNNTDILVVSAILGTALVSSFSAYNAFTYILYFAIAVTLTDAVKSLLGKSYAKENNFENFKSLYVNIKVLNFIVAGTVASSMIIFFKTLVELFFDKNPKLSIIFFVIYVFYFYLRILRSPSQALRVATNTYNDLKNMAIANAVINLTLSIILTATIGIPGVILASIIALVSTEFWFEIYHLEYKKEIMNLRTILLQYIVSFTLTIVLSIIGYYFITPHITNFVILFIVAIPTFFVILLINIFVFQIFSPTIIPVIKQAIPIFNKESKNV